MPDAPSRFSIAWEKGFHTVENPGHVAAPFAEPHSLAAQRRGAIDLAFALRLSAWARHSAIFHAVEKSFPLRGKTAETFSIAWKNPGPRPLPPGRRPQAMAPKPFFRFRLSPPLVRRPQDVVAQIPPLSFPPVRRPQDVDAGPFFRILAGAPAKTTCGFSEDAALRATRAGLVSASGRPRSGRAEKRRVGFRDHQNPEERPCLPRRPLPSRHRPPPAAA